MAFMTEAQYFAGRAEVSRAASAAAVDPSVAFAHDELARRYAVASVECAGAPCPVGPPHVMAAASLVLAEVD